MSRQGRLNQFNEEVPVPGPISKVITLGSVPTGFDAPPIQQRCANAQGFSLDAEVRCAMNQRHKLEQLCRFVTRPAIGNEQLTLNSAGAVVLRLKSPYQDGTTHIVMSPLDKIARSDFEQPKVDPKDGGPE